MFKCWKHRVLVPCAHQGFKIWARCFGVCKRMEVPPQEVLFNVCPAAGHTGSCRGKYAVLHLLHSLTISISDLTLCSNLGLQNLLDNRGNAVVWWFPPVWVNYTTTAEQGSAALLRLNFFFACVDLRGAWGAAVEGMLQGVCKGPSK